METSQNPYASPQSLSHAQEAVLVSTDTAWNPKWDRLLLVLMAATCIVGAPMSLWGIETIMGSGGAITFLGLALFCREVHCRRRGRPPWKLGLVLSLAGPVFSPMLAAFIAANGWSPGDAKTHHVDWIVVAFGVAVLLGIMLVYPTMPKLSRPVHNGE